MKINFLLLTFITATITSCSTAYRSGQTPDDVYYSPARLQTDDVRRDDDNKNGNDNSVYSSPEDREIRRRVRNRRYRRYDDRYDYPYGYNNGNYGNYGNPKYGTTQQNTQKPRTTNLGAYTPNTTTTDSTISTNPKSGKINTGTTTNPVRTFSSPDNSTNNKGSAVGNLIRKVLSGDGVSSDNNSSNSRSSNPSRTFDNNRSSSNNNSSTNSGTKNSTSESKSSSAPVRTFKNN